MRRAWDSRLGGEPRPRTQPRTDAEPPLRGAGGIYGFRSPYGAKWSEEYQAKALGAQLEAVLGAEDCAGVYLWQFCDIRMSDEWWGVRPRTMNNKGVFDEYRRPKLCAEVVKKIFRET